MLGWLFNALNWLEANAFIHFPLPYRIALLGLAAGTCAIVLYKLVSNQAKISSFKTTIRKLRREILKSDLEYSSFVQLNKQNFKTSFKLLGYTLGPAILSAIPVLIVASWLHTYHGYAVPKQETIELQLSPVPEEKVFLLPESIVLDRADGHFTLDQNWKKEIQIKTGGEIVYEGNPFSPPTPEIGKDSWWKSFFSPLPESLRDKSTINTIKLDLPRKQIMNIQPHWLFRWEGPYFIFVFIAAVAIKVFFRIQ